MAAHQCPNCGGYKTYAWWSPFIGQVIGAVVLTFVGGIGLLFAPCLVWAWFKKPAGLWPYCCRICEYSWEAGSEPARGRLAPRPGLLQMGNVLLEEEAAAAHAADEERRRRR